MTMLEERPVIERVRHALDGISLDNLPRPDLDRIRDEIAKLDLREEIAKLDLPEEIPGPWRDRIRADRRRRVAVVGGAVAAAVGLVAAVVLIRPLRDGVKSIASTAGRALGRGGDAAMDDDWANDVPVMAPASMADEPADLMTETPRPGGLDTMSPDAAAKATTGNGLYDEAAVGASGQGGEDG